MKKTYEAPMLLCEEYVPDTMIATARAKNNHAGNNQNCWECDQKWAQYSDETHKNDCAMVPGDGAYEAWCK